MIKQPMLSYFELSPSHLNSSTKKTNCYRYEQVLINQLVKTTAKIQAVFCHRNALQTMRLSYTKFNKDE